MCRSSRLGLVIALGQCPVVAGYPAPVVAASESGFLRLAEPRLADRTGLARPVAYRGTEPVQDLRRVALVDRLASVARLAVAGRSAPVVPLAKAVTVACRLVAWLCPCRRRLVRPAEDRSVVDLRGLALVPVMVPVPALVVALASAPWEALA